MLTVSRATAALTAAALALTVGAVAFAAPSSSEPGPFPGLPRIESPADFPQQPRDAAGWLNAAQVGLAGSVPARQWARVPLNIIAINAALKAERFCGLEFGPCTPGQIANTNDFDLQVFLVSPDNDREAYGNSLPIPVRSVVFGSIPVEAELQVRQERTNEDLPVPFRFRTREVFRAGEPGAFQGRETLEVLPARLEAALSVAVKSLKLDGVDIGLRSGCETGSTSSLDASSGRLFGPSEDIAANFDPRVAADASSGGTFFGTITIGEFKNCLTESGDRLDAVLTSALSGSENPVTLTYGGTFCIPPLVDVEGLTGQIPPAPPGANTPEEASCIEVASPGSKVVTIPAPWEIPGEAPGVEAPTP